MSLPNMTKVNSSNLDEIGYKAETEELYVCFKSNDLYVYYDVPESEYTGLMKASSHGKYLNEHIKPKYRYKKLS